MGQEYLLQVQNVTKQYGEKIALNDFSMDICQGEIVALIGENGAGKTTLLNIICGYCKPSAGQVQYKGKNIVANPLITREFGVLIEPQFLDYISAEENLRLLCLHRDELLAGGCPAQVVNEGQVPIRGQGCPSAPGEAGGEQLQQGGEVRPVQGEGEAARVRDGQVPLASQKQGAETHIFIDVQVCISVFII